MKPLSPIKKLQQRIDALIVQLDLGKLDAMAQIEVQITKLRASIERLGEAANESTVIALKRHLDDLQVQLKLGKMETRDAYLQQQEALAAKIEEARLTLVQAKHEAAEEFGEVAHTLHDKLNLLILNLNAAGLIAQENLASTKANVRNRLATLSGTLQAKAELAGESAHQVISESRSALEDILSNLRSLVGRR